MSLSQLNALYPPRYSGKRKDKMTDIIINDIAYDLANIERLAWIHLVNGSLRPKDGFHTVCVGTVNEIGEATLRTVVNRKVDERQKTIFIHTDVRSQKFKHLQKDNRVSLLFYNTRLKIQLAIKAKVILHTDDQLADDNWKITNLGSRRIYMTLDTPNTKSDVPTVGYEERFSDLKPSEAESNLFRKNFCVIECQAYELEFIILQHSGNKKAGFVYENGVLKDSFWAVP